LPTDFSARIARNTQLFLQQESGTNRIIDPWGGSYYVERLTRDLAAKAWGHIQEVEELGGMAKAIEAGVPKLRIEEASAKTQARIDAGKQAVIGVNKYKPVDEAPIDVLKVDNTNVRRLQIDKLKRLRQERNQKDVDDALAALTRSAGEGNGNLLALAIDAARQAVENDVHILGGSSLAAAHLTAVPELKAALKKQGREDIMIIIGGVVPPQDYDALYKAGAEAIYPPGTVIADAAEELIHKLNARLGHSAAAE